MKFFIYLIGIGQMIAGVMFFVVAASAIHQILGAVTFGLGAVCFAVGAVVDRLDRYAPKPLPKTPEERWSDGAHVDVKGMKGRGWKAG